MDASHENVRAVKRALASLPDHAAALVGGLEVREVLGVPVPVASKPLLIRMKQTVRDSDRADVRFLEMRIEEESG